MVLFAMCMGDIDGPIDKRAGFYLSYMCCQRIAGYSRKQWDFVLNF